MIEFTFWEDFPMLKQLKSSNVCDYLKDGINGFVVDDISDESLVDVLNKVAALSREEIDVLKKNSGEISFDYKCFSSQLWSFLHSI